jgi:flagellar basal body-associated protein FliL
VTRRLTYNTVKERAFFMSQKKVDAYKDYKKNRKEILKKEKRKQKLEIGIAALICAAFVAWFGFSVYQKATAKPAETNTKAAVVEVNMTDYEEFISGLTMNY